MNIGSIKINEIENDEGNFLSYPIDISKCKKLLTAFPFTNFVLIDKDNNIIFGFEFIEFFKKQMKEEIEVVRTDISNKEALISAYNYKEKFFGFNTYEKLVFIKKALFFFSIPELYERIDIDISINNELKNNLDIILNAEFKNSLILDKINLKSVLQVCKWKKNDSKIIIDFLSQIPFSKSQQLIIIEMFEELIFKEKTNAGSILKKLSLENLFEQEKPQKKIIEKIFSYRYPNYQKEAALWEQNIKKLKLPPNVKVTHFPFFEKKDIELKISVKKKEDIEKIVQFIKNNI